MKEILIETAIKNWFKDFRKDVSEELTPSILKDISLQISKDFEEDNGQKLILETTSEIKYVTYGFLELNYSIDIAKIIENSILNTNQETLNIIEDWKEDGIYESELVKINILLVDNNIPQDYIYFDDSFKFDDKIFMAITNLIENYIEKEWL